jgi:hypothetical protein
MQIFFAGLVVIMFADDVFQPHYLALQRDSGLQHSLVQVLVPALHTAATAMQLPPDRRPGNLRWDALEQILVALLSEPLFNTFLEQLESSSCGGFSRYALRMLQSTCQLIAAAPSSCPVELTSSKFAALWHNLAALLGMTCSIQQHQQQQRGTSVPDAQRQQAVRLLLQALSRLPTALRLASGHCVLDGWCTILRTMHRLSVQEPEQSASHSSAAANGVCGYHTIDSLADLPALCLAGTALLRALPHAVTVSALADQQKQAEEQPDLGLVGGALEIAYVVCSIVDEIATYCGTLASGGPWSAADSAAAGEALWQLHTALCRCIHSIAAGSLATAARLVTVLSFVLNAAACVSAATPATADGTAACGARYAIGKLPVPVMLFWPQEL